LKKKKQETVKRRLLIIHVKDTERHETTDKGRSRTQEEEGTWA
jgi:hypothetical protein